MKKEKLVEGFCCGDLVGVLMPSIHIDEFRSKIGKDDNIIVISFLVNDHQAAMDLVNFLEIGEEWILDADISSSEIKPGSYLVFIELLRRQRVIEQILKIISNLRAASGLSPEDWRFRYINEEDYHPLTAEELKKHVPLSPKSYRDKVIKPIEDMKALSGIQTNEEYVHDNLIETLLHASGLK